MSSWLHQGGIGPQTALCSEPPAAYYASGDGTRLHTAAQEWLWAVEVAHHPVPLKVASEVAS